MNSSKRNIDKIRDELIKHTGNPFTVNTILGVLSRSGQDFDTVEIVKNKKVVHTVKLDGNPSGVFKAKI